VKIAIASGKGGTGKTTISVNLTSLLSEIYIDKKIILADLDVEEPNSALFLKSTLHFEEIKYKFVPKWDENKCTFCGKCKSICNFNAIAQLPNTILVFNELCHSCFACSDLCKMQALPMTENRIGLLKHSIVNENFNFIEGKLDIGQESPISLISQTKKYVKEHFSSNSIIFFDAPPGTSCPVIEAVKDVDFVILVSEPTPFGLHDLKLAIATMQAMKLKFGVVINRSGIGNNDLEKYCIENQISILGKIPNMRQIAELYSNGNLIYNEIEVVKNELIQIFENTKKLIES
jgi:MinD superfamily P-loop ATPase